jgi:hypothetical protein
VLPACGTVERRIHITRPELMALAALVDAGGRQCEIAGGSDASAGDPSGAFDGAFT